jgi:hypothetical protein
MRGLILAFTLLLAGLAAENAGPSHHNPLAGAGAVDEQLRHRPDGRAGPGNLHRTISGVSA